MDTIKIPKEKVVGLINRSHCKFSDYDSYTDYEVELVLDSYTRFKEGSSTHIYITFKDLASLLYDRNCSFECTTVIVV